MQRPNGGEDIIVAWAPRGKLSVWGFFGDLGGALARRFRKLMMMRPVLYDMTHLVRRLAVAVPTGIDRVDLAYARYFADDRSGIAGAVHYGRGRPGVCAPSKLGEIVRQAEMHWRESMSVEGDASFRQTREWLLGGSNTRPRVGFPSKPSLPKRIDAYLTMQWQSIRVKAAARSRAPKNAIYLNVAQHALENGIYFDWLSSRPDIRAVFFLHDLLPLDFPEFWWAGHEKRFLRRIATMLRHASALITASPSVRDRALWELKRRGLPAVPILACPLPSPLEAVEVADSRDAELAAIPYFVVVGTIEARKNHLLLLNIWRDLVEAPRPTPKLVIVGGRGWENEQVVDMLERCPAIADRVLETRGLSSAGLRAVVANARAVLIPSFAEGFGLPVVEALGLGVPVVASDIPVFRDVAQNRAIFREPIDGVGWREAIVALTNRESPLAVESRAQAALFLGNRGEAYFSTVRAFLAGL